MSEPSQRPTACPRRGDAAAHVLDSLAEHEQRAYVAHLEGCRACRGEVRALGLTAEALLLAAEPRRPPAALKERVMGVVRDEAELLRAAGPGADRVRPARRPARGLRHPLIAVAGALALAAAGIATGIELPAGAPTRTVSARSTLPSARARLELAGGGGRLVMTGLPRPAAGDVYEVWLKRPGRAPEPSGTFFAVAPNGTTVEDVHGSLRGVTQLMVTLEPRPGSAQPTAAPVIRADLA